MMKLLIFELRLVLQSRLALGALALLLALSSLAVWSGLQAVAAQQAARTNTLDTKLIHTSSPTITPNVA